MLPLPQRSYRTIWISDVHLGTRSCKADFLLNFLHHHHSEYLYLVGDIIDAWQLKKSWFWPQSHNDVIQKILHKVHSGTKVYYIPGNHDADFRKYAGILQFGGIVLVPEIIHETIDGRQLLVLHGDECDKVMRRERWLMYFGDWAYLVMLDLNHIFNKIRCKLGYSYWSLPSYIKRKIKNAVNFISIYEKMIVKQALNRKVDGVVCGHIHHAEISKIEGILYCNDGDWVENCTALVEDWDGTLSIVHWSVTRLL